MSDPLSTLVRDDFSMAKSQLRLHPGDGDVRGRGTRVAKGSGEYAVIWERFYTFSSTFTIHPDLPSSGRAQQCRGGYRHAVVRAISEDDR